MTNPKGWDETATGPTDTEETGSVAVSYTPGPWRMDEFSDPGASLATYGVWTDKKWNKTRCIAAVVDGPDAESNARLIASVPDLLEAGDELLDALLTVSPSSCYPRIVQDAMNAWIDARKKATGRA